MRVLVADPFPEEALADFRSLGLVVEHKVGLNEADLLKAVADAGILVVRSTRVGAELIEAGAGLNLIVRAGSGVNTIDVAVAELTMALVLAIERRIPDAVTSLRGGKWSKRELGKTRGLFGQSIGI